MHAEPDRTERNRGDGVESEDYFRQLNRGSDGRGSPKVGRDSEEQSGDWTAKEEGERRTCSENILHISYHKGSP